MDMIMAIGHIKGQEYDTIKNAIVENETMLLEALSEVSMLMTVLLLEFKYKGTRLVPVVDSNYDVV